MRTWVESNIELRSVPLVGMAVICLCCMTPASLADKRSVRAKPFAASVVEQKVGERPSFTSVRGYPIPGRTLSCDPPPLLPPEALNEADVVFRGTAVSSIFDRGLGIRKTRFRVHQVWKGTILSGVQVASNLLSTGLLLEDEHEYIVYADLRPNYLWSDACMGTSSNVAQHVSLLPRVSTWFDLLLPQLTK